MRIVLYGNPVTKKNSQRIIMARGHPMIIPSKAYKDYEASCVEQLRYMYMAETITGAVNLSCQYFMKTRRKIDLVNLLEATQDILTAAEVLDDDNSDIVVSLDGCGVHYDKANPRVEITITQKCVQNAF